MASAICCAHSATRCRADSSRLRNDGYSIPSRNTQTDFRLGLLDLCYSDSQDVEVVKHGIAAIFADESKQGDESTGLIVRSGSGKS